MLRLKNVNKTFFPNSINERIALADVNLELDNGGLRDGYRLQRCGKVHGSQHHRRKNQP